MLSRSRLPRSLYVDIIHDTMSIRGMIRAISYDIPSLSFSPAWQHLISNSAQFCFLCDSLCPISELA